MKSMNPSTCAIADQGETSVPAENGRSLWKKAIQISGWLIGAAALYVFLTRYFEWDSFIQNLSQASRPLLLAAVAAYCSGLVVRAVRWTYMVRCHQPLSWMQGYHVITISNLVNFLFPVRLGEVIKLVIVKRSCGVAYCSSTAASIIEKLTLFLIIIVFLSLAPFAGYHFNNWSSKFFPFLTALILVSTIVMFFGSNGMAWTKLQVERFLRFWGMNEGKLQRILTNRLIMYMEATIQQCHISAYTGWRLFWIVGLGLLTLVTDGLANYCLLAAFGLNLSFLQAIIAACFFNVLFLLPSPPVQVGTAEVFPVIIYSYGLKMTTSVVASASVVWHMTTVLILILLGIISLYAVGLRVGSVMNMSIQNTDKNRNI